MDLINTLTIASTLVPFAAQVGQATISGTGAFLVNYMKPTDTTLTANSVVDELDLHVALQTARALISTVCGNKVDMDADEWESVQAADANHTSCELDVVQVCVNNLRASMHLLHRDLMQLDAARTAHAGKWFAVWRRFDDAPHVQAMTRHKRLFDSRLKLLLDIVSALPRSTST